MAPCSYTEREKSEPEAAQKGFKGEPVPALPRVAGALAEVDA